MLPSTHSTDLYVAACGKHITTNNMLINKYHIAAVTLLMTGVFV